MLQAYSPLGSPGSTWMNGNVLKEPVVVSIAEKLGKTPAQVALRWNIQMGHSVLPKSVSEERIKQNLAVYDWSIPEDLLAKFSEIKQVSYATSYRHFSSTFSCFVPQPSPIIIYELLDMIWRRLHCYLIPNLKHIQYTLAFYCPVGNFL